MRSSAYPIMKYSLIIPTYNEAPVIATTVRSLMHAFDVAVGVDWEIIVADNASTDGTADEVASIHDPRVRIIQLSMKGKGRALRAGFHSATGEIIGFTDADLAVPPEEIILAMQYVASKPDIVVIGSRHHVASVMPGREWWRTGSSRVFNILARIFLGIHASDTQCPLKVMSTRNVHILHATLEDTWFADLEFIALLERLDIIVEEVPVTWNEHRYPDRKSKLSTTKDGLRAIVAMFRIRMRLPHLLASLKTAK